MSVFITGAGSGTLVIPEFTSDPVSPAPQSAWVLHTASILSGSPIGLLLSLTYPNDSTPTYEFSYRTLEGTTVRVPLT